jgi:hypothetical protein
VVQDLVFKILCCGVYLGLIVRGPREVKAIEENLIRMRRGGDRAGNTPGVESFAEMRTKGFTLLIAWESDRPGAWGGNRGDLIQSGWWR